ncbi:alpha-crystallin B chain [Bombyx mori]|uniref:SHSP domain-containing protein n=3 Tax=cellular organisms TaxID=131567 RepID=A0A8R2LV58_BOMMO|nr:alpha-crystallin B chain [Bombyx mori]XP_037867042.1 alpha-crystallin B chain [Bombyx mori]
MFSPRLFAVFIAFAGFATVTALPARDKEVIAQPVSITDDQFTFPWLNLSPFSLFAPLWKLIPTFVDIGPRIYADDDKFKVVVNVKDYKKDNLKVKVKGDFIFVQGSQEAKEDDHDVFASQFFHTYSLPVNSSAADVTAELTSDGYLVVTAPISENVDKTKNTERVVPIVETGAPYKKDEPVEKTTVETLDVSTTQEPKTSAPAVVTAAPEPEEKKEPTTPSELDEATEKDNVIPHGNEVSA